ncbi:MAG TPA: hypothetical protein VF796_08395 [Humisphaera sp.]
MTAMLAEFFVFNLVGVCTLAVVGGLLLWLAFYVFGKRGGRRRL